MQSPNVIVTIDKTNTHIQKKTAMLILCKTDKDCIL